MYVGAGEWQHQFMQVTSESVLIVLLSAATYD
jgi:hypothetical protein